MTEITRPRSHASPPGEVKEQGNNTRARERREVPVPLSFCTQEPQGGSSLCLAWEGTGGGWAGPTKALCPPRLPSAPLSHFVSTCSGQWEEKIFKWLRPGLGEPLGRSPPKLCVPSTTSLTGFYPMGRKERLGPVTTRPLGQLGDLGQVTPQLVWKRRVRIVAPCWALQGLRQVCLARGCAGRSCPVEVTVSGAPPSAPAYLCLPTCFPQAPQQL